MSRGNSDIRQATVAPPGARTMPCPSSTASRSRRLSAGPGPQATGPRPSVGASNGCARASSSPRRPATLPDCHGWRLRHDEGRRQGTRMPAGWSDATPKADTVRKENRSSPRPYAAGGHSRVAFIVMPGTGSISPLTISATACAVASLPEGFRTSLRPKSPVQVLGRASRIIPLGRRRCLSPCTLDHGGGGMDGVPASRLTEPAAGHRHQMAPDPAQACRITGQRRGAVAPAADPAGRGAQTRCFFRNALASSGHDASVANRNNRACPTVDACRSPDGFGRGPSHAKCGLHGT